MSVERKNNDGVGETSVEVKQRQRSRVKEQVDGEDTRACGVDEIPVRDTKRIRRRLRGNVKKRI